MLTTEYRRRRRPFNLRSAFTIFLLVLLMLFIAAFCGLVLSLGNRILDIVLGGVIGGVMLLLVPLNWLIGCFLIFTLLVLGPAIYFSNLSVALWIPYMLGAVLFVRFPLELLKMRIFRSDSSRGLNPRGSSPLVPVFLLFLAVVVVSTLINWPPMLQVLVSTRSYLFLWGLTFILGFCTTDPIVFDRIWKFFVIVGLCQLPFTAFQLVYVVGILGRSWDAISGTFGGSISGLVGGSGPLPIFQTLVLTYIVILWREKRLNPTTAVWLTIAIVASVMMAEVKVVMVLMPLAVVLALYQRIFANPMQGVLTLLGIAVVAGGVFLFYQKMFWSRAVEVHEEAGWEEMLEKTFDYMLAMESDADFINLDKREVSRIAAINIWISEHRNRYSRAEALIGHGSGASRVGGFMGMGTVAEKYPFSLMANTQSMLLWDFGLLGLSAFVLLFLTGAYRARCLMASPLVPPDQRMMLEAASIMLFLEVLLMLYQRTQVDVPQEQVWLAVLFGQVIYWDVIVRGQRKSVVKDAKRRRRKLHAQMVEADDQRADAPA